MRPHKITRRRLIQSAAGTAIGLSLPAWAKPKKRKVLILGFDGMDAGLLRKYSAEGLLPNFQRLIAEGDFKPLRTTMPPQSPVAWSSFITGMDPGGHGIFDFVHRRPDTMAPYMSMSEAVTPTNPRIASWVIPLRSGRVDMLRHGQAFWQILEEHGVKTTIFRMPVNFPPVESGGRSLSGMGTPDVTGSQKTFSFFTENPPPNSEDISGGIVYEVEVIENRVNAHLIGPKNTLRVQKASLSPDARKETEKHINPDTQVDFSVDLDPSEPVAKISIQANEVVLKEGEWSDWLEIEFEMIPWLAGASALIRFYLQEVRPNFRLYVSPPQINPRRQAMPITIPEDWGGELCKDLGYFYTQQFPEETKALSGGIFTGREFWTQAQMVYEERRRALDYCLERFKGESAPSLLFFYFSSLDQGCHMLWRYMDEKHPVFDSSQGLDGSIRTLYQEMDDSLGRAMEAMDDNTTLIAMSDHGFSPFYRGVNLNTWLADAGYISLKDWANRKDYEYFGNVNWNHTKAYALGLNGVYLNLRGREQNGIVSPEEYEARLDVLERDLLAMRDPLNGQRPITLLTRTRRDYSGPYVESGPDLIIGYNEGFRSSWESPLGEFPEEIFVDNKDAWSADHCMNHEVIPGILVTNRRIVIENPALHDLTIALLNEFGVPPTSQMIGKNCLEAAG